MNITIKYCGGCNPRFDRTRIAARIMEDYPDARLQRPGEGESDYVAVICGCPAACADHGALFGRLGKVILTQESDYEKLRQLLGENNA